MNKDQFKQKPTPPNLLHAIQVFAEAKWTPCEIAAKVGITHQRVRRLIAKYGWVVRSPESYRK